jgi:hypothetical protein
MRRLDKTCSIVKIAHIVKPVIVDKSSDLFLAQPITFESMRRAKHFVAAEIGVELFSAQYEEDKLIIPGDFTQTPNLDRSVLDIAEFKIRRKLPLLRDILDRLFHASTADYFIYTNADIAVKPEFYSAVSNFIKQGYDSFAINRRTISSTYSSVQELDLMYADPGKMHRGWDCFIFPRNYYPQFKLYDVCLGTARVGLALLANLVAFSRQFKEFRDEQLTFHIGDPRNWVQNQYKDYYVHNTNELMKVLATLEEECGAFPRNSIPGSFLYRKRRFGRIYETWSRRTYLPGGLAQIMNRISGRR